MCFCLKKKNERIDFQLSCGPGASLSLTTRDWLCGCCCVSCFWLQELPSLHTMQQLVLMPPSHLSSPSPFLLSQSPTSHQGIQNKTKPNKKQLHKAEPVSILSSQGQKGDFHFSGLKKTWTRIVQHQPGFMLKVERMDSPHWVVIGPKT